MSSKLKENTCVNQPSVSQFMTPNGTQKKRKTPSAGTSPSEQSNPPKKRIQPSTMSETDLVAMEKRISENVTTSLKQDMKKLMKESMKDTMKEMIDSSLQTAINSMNTASKRMEECSVNMMSKGEAITSLVEENVKLNIKVSQLETEHDKLNRRLKQIEERSLDSNLIIKGIAESKWEKEHEIKTKIYNELSKTIEANTDQERQQIVRRIGIKQCKRLGKFTEGQNRPLSVEFLLKEDAVYLLENKNNLRKGIYIDKEYSADVEYQRKLLRPILQAAKRTKGLEKKCKMLGPSLEIKGRKITTKTLHKLPKELDVFTITSKRHEDVIGFFGELNALSNFHPAEFVLDGIKFPTSEHYIQYTKAVTFGDQCSAAKILNAKTPADSKALGWKITNFDKEKWDENAKTLCIEGIRAKFLQNKKLLDTLLRTKGHMLVEAAKDKIWGTGSVLARDDWHDDTLWHGQGILGEMLCEIRDKYLLDHPNIEIQELVYPNRSQNTQVINNNRQSKGNRALHLPSTFQRSQSYPELSILQGVPNSYQQTNSLAPNSHLSDHKHLGSSPNLRELPAVPSNQLTPRLTHESNMTMNEGNDDMDTLQPEVPTAAIATPERHSSTEQSLFVGTTTSLSREVLTPTQSVLMKLSQTDPQFESDKLYAHINENPTLSTTSN